MVQGGTSVLTATVVKGTGNITKVDFLDSTGAVAKSDDTAPYTYDYTTTSSTTVEDKTFTAKATDSNALTATSAPATVKFTAPVALPTVSVAASAGPYLLGQKVTLTATTTPDTSQTVSKVEFFEGANTLGEDTSSPFTFDYNPRYQRNHEHHRQSNG